MWRRRLRRVLVGLLVVVVLFGAAMLATTLTQAIAPVSLGAVYDKVKTAMMMETDRAHVLREAIMCCRNGGVVSVIGVYGGFMDKFPAGSWMNRSITLRTGQCHVQRYMRPLLGRIERGEIDPTRIITIPIRNITAPPGWPKGEPTSTYTWIDKTWPTVKTA